MTQSFPKQLLGHFSVQGKDCAGSVTFNGTESRLEIFSAAPMFIDENSKIAVPGVARDGAKITACNCTGSGVSGSHFYHGIQRHFLSLFPHQVAIGPFHIDPTRTDIISVCYTFPTAVQLFYDLRACGSLSGDPKVEELISNAIQKDGDLRDIHRAECFYFADRGPLVDVTSDGVRIRASNSLSWRFPSPRGIQLKNNVRIDLEFSQARTLDDAMRQIYEVQSCLSP